MIVIEILFWFSVLFVLYTFIGYPILLFVLASARQTISDLRFIVKRSERRTTVRSGEWPAVSLVVAAYNEAASIAAKVENSLAIDYPPDKFEIIIASDGSTDATNDIVRSYSDPRLRLMAYEQRGGKISVINRTVPAATHDIVILSDATTVYDTQAVKNAAKHFVDPKVGVVVGEVTLQSSSQDYKGESHYWRYEMMLKFMENRLGVVVGASGALCAIRRELFEPVPDSTIVDDFVIPLKIAEKGYRQVYCPEASVIETTAADVQSEYKRRKRIAAGNFQSILLLWRLLNPLRGYIALTFISHKIMRWTAPFFMASALAANVVIAAAGGGRAYLVLLGLQGAFYLSAAAGIVVKKPAAVRKLLAIPYYFVSMNIGMMQGFFNFVRGRQKVTWDKARRTE